MSDDDAHGRGRFTISAINRLGERLRKGSRDRADLQMLSQYREDFEPATAAVGDVVRWALFCDATLAARAAKSTISIIAKLVRERSRLAYMQDLGGVRVVVAKVSQQNRLIGLILEKYPDARVVDRRAEPKSGYRGVHVIVMQNERLIEVQVRTRLQNAWAQYSEKLADQYGEEVKYGGGPSEIRTLLDRYAEWVKAIEVSEVAMDAEKRKVNPLLRRRRVGPPLTLSEEAQLAQYQRLQAQKRTMRFSGFKALEVRAVVRGSQDDLFN